MLDNLTSRNDPFKKTELAGKTKRKKGRGKRNLSCPPHHMYDVLSHTREDTIPGQQCNDRGYNASEIEHGVSHQPFHSPVGIGWRMAYWAGSIVNQSHKEK